MGDKEYSLPKESYVHHLSEQKCILKLKSHEFKDSPGYWILGDSFLQNYQVIFDMDSMRVGFVGDFRDKTAPLEMMDALTYIVGTLLAATIIFVAC